MISVKKIWILTIIAILLAGMVIPAAVPVRAAVGIPPTVMAYKDAWANGIGWTDVQATVTLMAFDEDGIQAIHYQIDSGAEVTVNSDQCQFSYPEDNQKHTITYWAVDTAGISSDPIAWVPRQVSISTPTNGKYYQGPPGTPDISPDDPAYDPAIQAGWDQFRANFDHVIYTITDYTTTPATSVTTDMGAPAWCDPGINFAYYFDPDPNYPDNYSSAFVIYTVIGNALDVIINFPADDGKYKVGTLPAESDYNRPYYTTQEDSDKPYYYSVSYYDQSYSLDIQGYSVELGTHTVTVTATAQGNSASDSATYKVSKSFRDTDYTPPKAIVKSPVARTYYTYEYLRVHFGAQSKCGKQITLKATLDGQPVKNMQKINLCQLGVGHHVFVVDAWDGTMLSKKTIEFNVAVATRKAEIKVTPQTINLKSQGDVKAVTAIINLFCAHLENRIDLTSVKMNINGILISALPSPSPHDPYCTHMVKFDRQQVIDALTATCTSFPCTVTVTVSGVLKDGTKFTGTDKIKVLNQECPQDDHHSGKPGDKDNKPGDKNDDHYGNKTSDKDNKWPSGWSNQDKDNKNNTQKYSVPVIVGRSPSFPQVNPNTTRKSWESEKDNDGRLPWGWPSYKDNSPLSKMLSKLDSNSHNKTDNKNDNKFSGWGKK